MGETTRRRDSRAPEPDSCWTREARGVPPTDEVGKWRGEEDRPGFGEDMAAGDNVGRMK